MVAHPRGLMNLRAKLVLGGLLVVGTGCPHDWMKGGTNDRAMAKDMREMLEDDEECPEGKTLRADCVNTLPDGSCRVTCQ
ncbi:hypothetical protein DB31_5057 [Hyalangium minutum]|uniref:Lipoprotein n=2 Tax=Hyalangium minutum TaxID=394096 RepID=A0A085WQQ2_9BACT|nr:hypothetical protein DB31_5057 [Hyalangium minutum]